MEKLSARANKAKESRAVRVLITKYLVMKNELLVPGGSHLLALLHLICEPMLEKLPWDRANDPKGHLLFGYKATQLSLNKY